MSAARWSIWPLVAVAALVVALVLPQCFGTIYYSTTPNDIARRDVMAISDAISRFARERGRLPNGSNELIDLDAKGWPYLDSLHPPPPDPWRHPYIYEPNFTARTWRVLSLGRDGELDGSGDDADIICEGSIGGVKSLTNPNELPRTSKR